MLRLISPHVRDIAIQGFPRSGGLDDLGPVLQMSARGRAWISIIHRVRNTQGKGGLRVVGLRRRYHPTLVQPSGTLDKPLSPLGFVPAEYRVSMHGIGRETRRDIHSVNLHPLGEPNDVIKYLLGTSAHDIGPREPREKFGAPVNVWWDREFGSGGDISIVFRLLQVDFADICAGGVGRVVTKEYVRFRVEVVGGIGSRVRVRVGQVC